MKSVKKIVPMPKSKFLEVECKKCGEKHIVFNKSATAVVCECGEEIVSPTGGHAQIKGRIKRVLA